MGALPKQRVSKGRKGRRRSHHHLKLPTLVPCQNCKQLKVAHHVCPNCATYRGRYIPGIIKESATEQ
jgi:large subunit ribosomal protein L32